MRLLPAGDAGLLVEMDSLQEVLSLYADLADRRPEGIVDMVPAARTLLLHLDPTVISIPEAEDAVTAARPHPGARSDTEHVQIPVIYDGPDLADVARLTGLGERGVVEAHTTQEWTVAFCGFSPGFGYLVCGERRLHVPRRSTPRTSVPAGAVGLAGEFTGVYPRESPGGWQLIGHTTRRLWDPDQDPPAVLSAGVHVRFTERRCDPSQ